MNTRIKNQKNFGLTFPNISRTIIFMMMFGASIIFQRSSWKCRKARELDFSTYRMRNLIIGSGITGLTIGKVLTNKKIGFKILESQSEIGGRLQTSLISGHFVDVGFQVLLRKYPALKLFPEINELDFMDMKSGFIIYKNGSFYKILNPLRNILGLIYYNKFPGFSLKDKLLLIKILTLSKPLNKEIKTLNILKNMVFLKLL